MLTLYFLIILDIVKICPKPTSLAVNNITIKSITSESGFNLSQS
jgi:hypothetical protein